MPFNSLSNLSANHIYRSGKSSEFHLGDGQRGFGYFFPCTLGVGSNWLVPVTPPKLSVLAKVLMRNPRLVAMARHLIIKIKLVQGKGFESLGTKNGLIFVQHIFTKNAVLQMFLFLEFFSEGKGDMYD